MRAFKRRPRLRQGVVVLLSVLAAVILGLLIPKIPIGFETEGSETVQFLVTVAAGVFTFTGVVYSLLFLVVQNGSASFTPRLDLVRNSPIILYAFGYFTGVLVFAVTAAFAIGNDEQVTGLVVTFLTILLLGLLATLVLLYEAAFNSIQLSPALAQVGQRGRRALDDFYPDDLSPDDVSDVRPKQPRLEGWEEVRWLGEVTVLQEIDVARVLNAAESMNCLVEFRVRTGEPLFHKRLVAVVEGAKDARLSKEILGSMSTGVERTFEQDATFVFRVLTDIALRALSPGINDPTTAVQTLDITESLLLQLAGRDLEVGQVEDAAGVLRVVVPLPTWEDFLSIAIDEILSLPGPPMLQIHLRLQQLLDDLADAAPEERVASLRARSEQLKSPDVSMGTTPAATRSR